MDSTTDNSFRTLWSIVKTAGAPDYVRNGLLVDSEDAKSLSDMMFADSVNRRFPITDKANTWASAGYFSKTAGDLGYSKSYKDVVAGRIKSAAEVYGISKDVNEMMDKLASASKPIEKKAADDMSNYCDPENMGYPVFDKEGACLANDFFTENAYKYGHERRMSIAKNILKKCAEYGVKASEQVRLSAGNGFPNRDTLAEHMLFRANELMGRGRYKMASELCKMAQDICICSDDDLFANRNGIFNALSSIDEMTGIDDCYGRKFCAPEELAFDVNPDDLKAYIDDAVPLGNETFSAKALSGLPRKLFEMVLPEDMVGGMMDGGAINPKKLSVTIIKLRGPEKSHLLSAIKGFTDGEIEIEDDEPSDENPADGKDDEKDEKDDKKGKKESGKED